MWIPWRRSLYEDRCGLQQPVLCAIGRAIKKIGKPDYKDNDSDLTFVLWLFIVIDWLIQWRYYYWILKKKILLFLLRTLPRIQPWYQSQVPLKQSIGWKIYCCCCFLVQWFWYKSVKYLPRASLTTFFASFFANILGVRSDTIVGFYASCAAEKQKILCRIQ